MQSCPACGAGEFEEFCKTSFLGRDPKVISKCKSCRLGILLPQPTDAELSEYYSAVYFGFNKAHEDGKSWFFSKFVLGKRPKGRVLDVGCATGFFLAGLKKYSGWECEGVEFGAEAVRYGRETLGLEVRQGTLTGAAFEAGRFDFINMNNVLEHERDPLSYLKECARILKPGGEALVVIPNGRVDAQGYADYERKKGHPGGSRDGHTFFFSPRSLELLVAKSGLEFKSVHSAGLIRGLRALGRLPRTPTWYCGYVPRERRPVDVKVEDSINPGRWTPKAYHLFKHGKERLSRLKGFWAAGFDYHLLLIKPS